MALRKGSSAKYSAAQRAVIRSAARSTQNNRAFLKAVREGGVKGRDAVLRDLRNDVLDADLERTMRRQGATVSAIRGALLTRAIQRQRSVNKGEQRSATRTTIIPIRAGSRNTWAYRATVRIPVDIERRTAQGTVTDRLVIEREVRFGSRSRLDTKGIRRRALGVIRKIKKDEEARIARKIKVDSPLPAIKDWDRLTVDLELEYRQRGPRGERKAA